MKSLFKHFKNQNLLFKALEKLNHGEDKWVFRGVENSNYHLIPSVFRSDDIVKSWLGVNLPFEENYSNQLKNEFKILHKYFSEVNSIGLPILSNWEYFLDKNLIELEAEKIQNTSFYAFKKIVENMALAQHNGVPTRLLDFSFSPEVATYFACKDMIDAIYSENSNIEMHGGSVWAVNYSLLREEKNSPIEFYVTPYSNNLHINHQKGLFAIIKNIKSSWESSYPVIKANGNLEETELNISTAIMRQYGKNANRYIKCFSFSQGLKKSLIDALDQRGIHFASLMPSYTNVKEYLNKKMKFKKMSAAYNGAVHEKEGILKAAIARRLKSKSGL